ncbi:tetratricopeptide repeat protein, partial [Treponema endosymbiont of Eucomonympha sp.]|uniref:tetratricopeptide repeat protein n=1 Tax=Treponema endosymbiont of Eucomonympha sp. TaxID=1580831 RepID=UPI001396A425
VYEQKGDYDKAIADFGEAVRLKPDYAEAFNNRGCVYGKKGEHDNAIADFDAAIRLKPDYALAFNNRGCVYGNKGDYNNAIADFDATIRLKPDDAGAFNNRGIAYEKKGDYSKAIADFDAAIRLKLDYAKAFHNRGVAYIGLEKYTKAFEDYLTAVEKGFSGTGDAIIDAVFKNQPDLLWSADFKRLNAAPHYFLRLIAFCTERQKITKEYKDLITAVYSLWNALRCKQDDAGHIYQYTSLRVLENERVTRRFRLTPAGYQNDPEEGKVFYDRLKAFCKTDAISTVLDSIKSNSETVAFIRSFTALEDTLFMWDSSYAAHGEGAAVGIAKQKINKGFGIDSLSREMSLPAQSLEMPLNTLIKGKTDNPQTDAAEGESKNYSAVPTQEKTEQPKESAAEGESKKPVSVPMSSIGLYWVLYVDKTAENEKALNAVADNLTEFAAEFKEAYTELQAEGKGKYRTKENPFMDFLSKLFTPVAHLIKKETYKHEEEYRLLYVSSIENALAENYLQTDTTSDDVSTGIYVETGEILFKDSTEKDIVYF